jgi:hypothetical protein
MRADGETIMSNTSDEPRKLRDDELDAVIGGRQLPGATTPGKIVLKRGKNSSMELDAGATATDGHWLAMNGERS